MFSAFEMLSKWFVATYQQLLDYQKGPDIIQNNLRTPGKHFQTAIGKISEGLNTQTSSFLKN